MRRALPRTAACLCAVVFGAALFASSAFGAASSGKGAGRVYVVIATGLSWSDVDATNTPTLFRLAQTSAIGNLNARPKSFEGREPPSSLEGALDISSGNWANVELSADAPYGVSEPYDTTSTPAGVVYERETGNSAGNAAIVYVGLPPASRTATTALDQIVIGTLGDAIHRAGGVTAAIGNSDAGDDRETTKLERPAAMAAMDESGLVDLGDVSQDLLGADALAPYGVRTDIQRFSAALSSAEQSAAAHGGPALFVLDPGDAYRAERAEWQGSDAVVAKQHAQALGNLDAVVALALQAAGSEGTVIVAGEGPRFDTASGQQGFSPVIASGPGLTGYLTSSTTHRPGMVANPDITATVLERLGIERPVQVIGNPFAARPAAGDATQRISFLSAVNSTVTGIDAMRGPFIQYYVHTFAILLALVALFVVFGRRIPEPWDRRVRVVLAVCSLAVVAAITAGWAMFLFTPTFASPDVAPLAFAFALVALVAIFAAVWRLAGPGRIAPAALMLGSAALLAADQYAGAPLSIANLIGYSPLEASRYYGIGNEAAAFMLACALVGSALIADEFRDAKWALLFRRFGLPVIGLALVVAAAAPNLGANVGVAIWGVAGVVVAWAGMNGRKITWQTVLVGVLVIALLIGAFLLIDEFGGGAQTHLARSVSTAEQGGASQLVLIVQRKAAGNAKILLSSGWWLVALGASILFLGFLRVWTGKLLPRALAENPAFRAAVLAVLVTGVVALFTEDTGILILTDMSLPLCAAGAWLALAAAGRGVAE